MPPPPHRAAPLLAVVVSSHRTIDDHMIGSPRNSQTVTRTDQGLQNLYIHVSYMPTFGPVYLPIANCRRRVDSETISLLGTGRL
jgi:hypothetical protein